MDFNKLEEMRIRRNVCLTKRGNNGKEYQNMVSRFLKKYEAEFAIRYAYESTVIEGNTCSYDETRQILYNVYHDNKNTLKRQREIYEIQNHANTFIYAKDKLQQGALLDEKMIREFHRRLVENIFTGGIYRTENVGVGGSNFDFPDWKEVPFKMYDFCDALKNKQEVCGLPEMMHPVELSAWVHSEFVSIHPFRDGNGRTARMLSNYILMQHGYLPISVPITRDSTQKYYSILEQYHADGKIDALADFFGELEGRELGRMLELEKLKENSIILE